MTSEIYLTALHESAHVVLNEVFGIPTEYVEITLTVNGVSGYFSNVPHLELMKNMSDKEQEQHHKLWLISGAAGIAAEMNAGIEDKNGQWEGDIRHLELEAPNTDINLLIAIAAHFLKDNRNIAKAHKAVTRILLHKKRIDGNELHEIINSKISQNEKNGIRKEILEHV